MRCSSTVKIVSDLHICRPPTVIYYFIDQKYITSQAYWVVYIQYK